MEPVVLTGEIPDPTRIPPGCRFHPRCPALAEGRRRRRGRRRRLPPHVPLHGRARGGGPPRRLPSRRGAHGEPAGRGSCRPRCPGRCTSTRRRGRTSGSGCSTPQWFCVGRVDDLGLDAPGRLAVVDVAGESVAGHAGRRRRLHAAYNVCRHRGSQLVPVTGESGSGPVCAAAGALRCPYHSWTYALDGAAAQGSAHRRRGRGRPRRLLAPRRSGSRTGGASSSCTSRPASADALRLTACRQAPANARQLRVGALVTGKLLSYDVAANWKVLAENYNECYHCGPVHPELTRLVPAFGGGGADLDWDDGIPHREGAWTFTMTGTTDAVAAARADRGGADAAQGRARLPEPDAVLLRRPRRGLRAAAASPSTGPDIDCLLLFDPDAVRRDRLRPVRRGRLLGPGQPAGLGDLRVGAARDVVARLHAGLVRADGGRQPPTSGAGCCPAWLDGSG